MVAPLSCATREALASFAQTAGAQGRPPGASSAEKVAPGRVVSVLGGRRAGAQTGGCGAAAADTCAPWSWGRGPAQGALASSGRPCSLLCPHGAVLWGEEGGADRTTSLPFFGGIPHSL